MTARRFGTGLRYYYGQEKTPLGGCEIRALQLWAELEAGRPIDALLDSAEVLKRAMPLRAVAGVYFLIAAGEIKYVGQSMNLFKRIEEHRLRRSFDSYALLPCTAAEAPRLEAKYIASLRPPWNRTI